MKYDVYGVGNSLVDIQANISDQLLEELGYPKGGMTLVDEQTQVSVLEQLEGSPMTRCAGGSAANTIIGIVDFGGIAAYAGKTASDEIGEFCLEDMRKLGVRIEVPSIEGQTGTCVILISNDAERTMLTNLAVSSQLDQQDIEEEEIANSKYVYIEGYLFTGDSTKRAALKAIQYAKKHNVKVAFTVSDPFLINLFRDEFLTLIENDVDLLFCNLEEARSLTGKQDSIDCAQEIHKHCDNVAMTLGGDGSIIMHENKAIPIEGVPTHAVDTTGAGDMYAAGVLYGITNGLNWHDAGHLGSHAASRVVSQLGARLAKPFTQEEIVDLLS